LDGRIKLLAGTIDEIARAIERAIALRMQEEHDRSRRLAAPMIICQRRAAARTVANAGSKPPRGQDAQSVDPAATKF
jgi:hypothetical protein